MELILRELETLAEIIIRGNHRKNIRRADDTVLNADTERNQHELLD